jgi:hypothetical protein
VDGKRLLATIHWLRFEGRVTEVDRLALFDLRLLTCYAARHTADYVSFAGSLFVPPSNGGIGTRESGSGTSGIFPPLAVGDRLQNAEKPAT